jgi:hypothetical protein
MTDAGCDDGKIQTQRRAGKTSGLAFGVRRADFGVWRLACRIVALPHSSRLAYTRTASSQP